MATPMTPDQSLAAFRAEGLTVVEVPGYRTNDRTIVTGRPGGPKHGSVNHHTSSETANPAAYAASILFKGYSTLPGPICSEGLDVDAGIIYMVGTGRTNHAGGGDQAVLDTVIGGGAPLDSELHPHFGNLNGVDGNAPFYGLEMMYSGDRDLPRAGYVACVKWNTARARFHGWDGGSSIAHREWSSDKPDPGHVSMTDLRRDINAALALPAGVWPGTTTTPPPPTPEETDVFVPFIITALGSDPNSPFDDGLCVVTQAGVFSIPGPDHLYSINRWIHQLTDPGDRVLTITEVTLVQETLNPRPASAKSVSGIAGFASLPDAKASKPRAFSTAAGETVAEPTTDQPPACGAPGPHSV